MSNRADEEAADITTTEETLLPASDSSTRPEEADERDIAALAYALWQSRGCPDGSAEEDWYQAVDQLRSRHMKAASA